MDSKQAIKPVWKGSKEMPQYLQRQINVSKQRAIVRDFRYNYGLTHSEDTTLTHFYSLKFLSDIGVDLADPKHVDDCLKEIDRKNSRKWNLTKAYKAFASWAKLPKYEMFVWKFNKEKQYLPSEDELDLLIAYVAPFSTQMHVLLWLLKETGMRIGEACRLTWRDLNEKLSYIFVSKPEKGSRQRNNPISSALVLALCSLPTYSHNLDAKIFGWKNKKIAGASYRKMRTRLVASLPDDGVQKIKGKNIKRIHFHSFRHFVGTKTFIDSKSRAVVMEQLGHKTWEACQIYVDFAKAAAAHQEDTEQYDVQVAHTIEEAIDLEKAGYVVGSEWAGGTVKTYKKKLRARI